MSGRYAANTEVSSYRSREEIERTLNRYGADGFGYLWDGQAAMIEFRIRDRRVRFILPLPAKDAPEFVFTPGRRLERSAAQQAVAYEQAVRQRWRALSLVIKAKLEAVEAGIVQFDEEFLAHIVLPGGQTVGERVVPQMTAALASGTLPPLLPRTAGN